MSFIPRWVAVLPTNSVRKALNKANRQPSASFNTRFAAFALVAIMVTSPLLGLMSTAHAAVGLSATEVSSLNTRTTFPGGDNRTTIEAEEEPIREVLRQIGYAGQINLVLDKEVEGTVTLSLYDVTVNEALQSVAEVANLKLIPQEGNIFLVMPSKTAKEKGLNRRVSQLIPVKYANAIRLARVLNRSLFTDPEDLESSSTTSSGGTGSDGPKTVRADSRTNSLMVVGTVRDIELAKSAVEQLDVPRESRTYYLSHANALDVATQLSSSIFNDGVNPIFTNQGGQGGGGAQGGAGGAGGAGGLAGGANQMETIPAMLRVTQEVLTEGEGANTITRGTSTTEDDTTGDTADGTTDTTTTDDEEQTEITIRTLSKESTTISISPEGPLVIPDTRQNSITILGTLSQLDMAEQFIPVLDAKPPQVSIEVSLVEISETGDKELSGSLAIDTSKFGWGFNNISQTGTTVTSLLGGGVLSQGAGLDFNDNRGTGDLFAARLTALIEKGKAKSLANPTVVATHDTETAISIADQIRRGQSVVSQASGAGFAGFITQAPQIGQAGILLDILPRIGQDGTVYHADSPIR